MGFHMVNSKAFELTAAGVIALAGATLIFLANL